MANEIYKSYTSGQYIETGNLLPYGDDIDEQGQEGKIVKKESIQDRYLYNYNDRITLEVKCDSVSYDLISDWSIWIYDK